jgi:DNA adenine methylase
MLQTLESRLPMFRYERRAKPCLKWAGGKANCLSRLLEYFPTHFSRYLEPFLGGAAVFLALEPTASALLNDANEELISLYRIIRDNPLALMDALENLQAEYCEAFYYALRSAIPTAPVDRAARLIFLNKTCFNGLYRTNAKGEFNVPFGKRKRCPALYDRASLLEVSFRLRNAQLFCTDFEAVVNSAERGDLVYCDPPYLPSSSTANFAEYTASGFSAEDHRRLRDCCERAANRGATVVVSNSSSLATESLYRGWTLFSFEVPRCINSKAERRGSVLEIVAIPPRKG